MPHYNPRALEPHWQKYWEEHKTFRCPDPDDPSVQGLKKAYILDMFPYPSGAGLHVGHPEGYTATDILSRMRRMQGFHVLHPMGWDAFGLPAEQHAISTGEHPSINTQQNFATFRRQIKSLGFSYDWDREVDTTDPHYVKWTQWIFLQLYDTWFDRNLKKGRPIAELPIPAELDAQGDEAIRRYQDSMQLLINGFHELMEANIFPYSEPLHLATEPYGPDGRFGHYLSYLLVMLPLGWLVMSTIFTPRKQVPQA